MKILNSITTAAASDYLATTKTAMDEARAAEILEDAGDVALGAHLRSTPQVMGKTLLGAGAGALTGVAARAALGMPGLGKAMGGNVKALTKPYGLAALLGAAPGAVIGAIAGNKKRNEAVKSELGRTFPDSDYKAISKAAKPPAAQKVWSQIAGLAGMGLGGALGAKAVAKEFGPIQKVDLKSLLHNPNRHMLKRVLGQFQGNMLDKIPYYMGAAGGAAAGYLGGKELGEVGYGLLNRKALKERAVQRLIERSHGEEVAAGGERNYPGSASSMAKPIWDVLKKSPAEVAYNAVGRPVVEANKSAYEKLMAMVRKDGDGVPMIEAPE